MATTGTIGCKLPNGLTVEHGGKSVTLAGSSAPGAIMGYGLTHNVDLEWFTDWMTGDGRELPPVKAGLIFISGNRRNAEDQAAEQADDIRSGLEPLNPDKPAAGIEPTDEQKRENEKIAAAADGPPGTRRLR